MDNTYRIASTYENFIRTVFNCDVNKHGAALSNIQNVIFMEQGKTYSKHLGSLEKQFAKVRGYIEKALSHLAKGAKTKEDKEFFNNLLLELQDSTNSVSLMNIVESAFGRIKSRLN